MATAMMDGLETLDEPPSITICDPSEQARARHKAAGRRAVAKPAHLRRPTLIVLAFKPQHLAAAAHELDASLPDDALIVSVLAGVSTETLEACFPRARVVRVMPNTPMAVGQGMSGVAGGSRATAHDIEAAASLCRPSGAVLVVPEDRLDAITAVSGSGPAYFFRFCEVLVLAAQEELSFTEGEARLLVSQTARGAIAYLDSEAGFPAQRLRTEVTSPGGTTEAALRVFDEGGIAALAQQALRAAAHRARELDAATSASMDLLDRGRVA